MLAQTHFRERYKPVDRYFGAEFLESRKLNLVGWNQQVVALCFKKPRHFILNEGWDLTVNNLIYLDNSRVKFLFLHEHSLEHVLHLVKVSVSIPKIKIRAIWTLPHERTELSLYLLEGLAVVSF